MIQLKRVLVPIDFSKSSDRALRYGQQLCEKFGADLHLMHVLEVHLGATPQFGMGLALPQRTEESETQVIEMLSKLPAGNVPAEINIVRSAAHGSPVSEIVKYADANEIDVIVIGTHGRTGLGHVLMGSVAENVVRHATCPVLVVRGED